MTQPEELKRGAQVKDIDPHQLVTVIVTQWHSANAVELPYMLVVNLGMQGMYWNSKPTGLLNHVNRDKSVIFVAEGIGR